jgi:hypothetical protein
MLRPLRRILSGRPRSQGYVHHPSQFLAGGTACSLDRHAMNDRGEVPGEIARVCIGWQVAVRYRALEALA